MSEMPEGSDQQPPQSPMALNPRKVRTVRNIVLLGGIVVLVVVGFALLVGHLAAKPSSATSFGTPDLPSVPAGPDFASLDKAGAVPANVLDALAVPAGSTVVSRVNRTSESESPFDAIVTFTSPQSRTKIAKFFPAFLAQQHWRVERSSNPILGLIEGTDSNYWELGVTISSPAPAPGGYSDGTRFTVELYTYESGE